MGPDSALITPYLISVDHNLQLCLVVEDRVTWPLEEGSNVTLFWQTVDIPCRPAKIENLRKQKSGYIPTLHKIQIRTEFTSIHLIAPMSISRQLVSSFNGLTETVRNTQMHINAIQICAFICDCMIYASLYHSKQYSFVIDVARRATENLPERTDHNGHVRCWIWAHNTCVMKTSISWHLISHNYMTLYTKRHNSLVLFEAEVPLC
jgi:hypothetical protein